MSNSTHICVRCRQEKPLYEFVNSRVSPNPYDVFCHQCRGITYDEIPLASVYILVDPRDSRIFYVGCATDLKQRLQNHISSRLKKGNPRKTTRIENILKAGLVPLIIPIEKTHVEFSLIRERAWIIRLASMGAPLTNCVKGNPRRYVVDDYIP